MRINWVPPQSVSGRSGYYSYGGIDMSPTYTGDDYGRPSWALPDGDDTLKTHPGLLVTTKGTAADPGPHPGPHPDTFRKAARRMTKHQRDDVLFVILRYVALEAHRKARKTGSDDYTRLYEEAESLIWDIAVNGDYQ